jgi:hypothetical protein
MSVPSGLLLPDTTLGSGVSASNGKNRVGMPPDSGRRRAAGAQGEHILPFDSLLAKEIDLWRNQACKSKIEYVSWSIGTLSPKDNYLKFRMLNKEFRTAEVGSAVTSTFIIPCSTFCGSKVFYGTQLVRILSRKYL